MNTAEDESDGLDELRRRLIAETLANAPSRAAPAGIIRPTDRGVDLPLSSAQERMWFSQNLTGRSRFHVLDLAYRVDTALDQDALQAALDAVVERHEVLRTSIVSVDGIPVQRVAAPSKVSVEWHHTAASDALALRLTDEFVQRPFDVTAPPLIRAGVWSHSNDTLFILTVPHLVCDALSADILVSEVVDAYRLRCRGESLALQPLDVQFGDYAAWQRTKLEPARIADLLAHWTTRLTESPVVSVPTDYARPSLPSGRGGVVQVRLSCVVRGDLERLAGEHDATPFMVLLAAYFVVLSQWSGQDDIVVGTPSAGRTEAELSGLVGMFVDTLPIRLSIARGSSFREVLSEIRARVLDAFDHQELPFEQIVRALNCERDLSRHPIFQIWFVLQGETRALELPGGTTFVPVEIERDEVVSPFDISLMVTPANGEFRCDFTYARELFDPTTIEQMAALFTQVVETATKHPDTLVSQLCRAQGASRSALLANAGDQRWSVIQRRPWIADNLGTALIHAEGIVEYGRLVEEVEYLSTSLEAHGVPPGTLIGIYLPRSVWSVLAMYATWRFGGAFVHLDVGLPQARLRHMIADAGIRWVIVDESTESRAAEHGLHTVNVLHREGSVAAVDTDRHREPSTDAQSMAYAIFTSGSTGMPKAVSVGHAAIESHVAVAIERYGIGPTDRVLAFSSFSFDAVLDQVLPAIAAGASVVLGEHGQILPDDLSRLIARNGVTVVNLPPSYWLEWVNTMGPESPKDLSSLRLLILGGEAIDPAALDRWRQLAPHVVVLNAYGPTEATVTATVMDVGMSQRLRAPIGRPLGNRTAYVVDADLELSPPGTPGELLIGGPELALGYVGNAARTAERFIPDVFGGHGGRLYRTGDRVRWLEDGNLEFLGRIDGQLKLRGFRVEPSEVEEVLGRFPGVRSAAVVPASDAQSLHAFVVGEGVRLGELRHWCRDQLPRFMVPSRIQLIEALPLGTTGKLDRNALSALESSGARDQDDPYVAPRNDDERAICALWAEVLGLDVVGIDDGFFDLGGHSLVAATVVAQVGKRLGKRLELRQLFENPTARQFAALLPAAEAADPGSVIDRTNRAQLPMSAAQERLWFLDRVSSSGQDYLMWFAWRVHGPVNRAAWELALNDLIGRHEVLRTGLVEDGGVPTQVVHQDCPATVQWTDVPDFTAGEEAASRFVRQRFDLQCPPLIRASGWSVGDEQSVLAISLHHVVADGWSKKILLKELFHFYEARTHGREPTLAELPIQYGDYALWERRRLDGARINELVQYWTSQLHDLEALDLHHDRPRPATRAASGELLTVTIPAQLLSRVDDLRRSAGVTRFMVLLAAFQVVLGRWSGHDDVAVGTPVAGRNHTDLEPLIGFFANSVVLRSRLGGDPPFTQLLESVRETVLDAFEHQELPFGRVVDALQPERSLTRNPLFDVMFDVQEEPSATPSAPGLMFEVIDLDWESSKFDLTCSVVLLDVEAQVHFEYDRHLFDRATIDRLANHFVGLLDSVTTTPDVPVLSADMSGPGERELVAGFSYPSICTTSSPLRLPTGGRTAVICGNLELTYDELDAKVGGLAQALARRGVARGTRVAVVVKRGIWPLVSMLAIWRLGAVLVPVDSGTPEPRLRYIMTHSRVEHVIVDSDSAVLWGPNRIDVRGMTSQASVPTCDLRPEDPAYIIFTSGTSGRPKGVLVQHSALWQHVADARVLLAMTPDDRVLTFSSSAFDAYFEQVLPPLVAGACLVIRPDHLWTVSELARVIQTHGVTVMELTPAYWSQVASELADVSAQLLSLRRVVSGGDVLSTATAEQWIRYVPNAPILNTYGPTEATISSTAYDVRRQDGRRIPIGRPVGQRRVYVVDRNGTPVPIGVPGELLIGGDCLARGYVGDPRATASSFVPDWFENQGGRLYRTGDLARWLPDGNLEFVGRKDDQVKIRGFRIEPQEVAQVIREMDCVRDVLVAVDDSTDDRVLVAYVSGDDLAAEDIQAWCRRMLPTYMIPAHVEVLAEMPVTSQGKVDQRRLPRVALDEKREDDHPSSATEIVVAQLWCEVLGIRHLGRDSNFFQAGGHSIRAVSAVAKSNRTFATQLRVNDLFAAPTVRGFARRVEAELEAQVRAMADTDLDLTIGQNSPLEDRS